MMAVILTYCVPKRAPDIRFCEFGCEKLDDRSEHDCTIVEFAALLGHIGRGKRDAPHLGVFLLDPCRCTQCRATVPLSWTSTHLSSHASSMILKGLGLRDAQYGAAWGLMDRHSAVPEMPGLACSNIPFTLRRSTYASERRRERSLS